jgi:hypothetical protein
VLKNVKVTDGDTIYDLEEDYPNLMEAGVPVRAIPTIIYRVNEDDLREWVEKTYPSQRKQEAFWEALGVNTRDSLGLYLWDVEAALRRLKGKPTGWD